MKLTYTLPLLLGVIIPFTVSANTVIKIQSATIKSISYDTEFGHCHATLNKAPSGACTSKTISFDCKGKYYKNGQGKQYYATALLAFSLEKKVNVWVDSNKKHQSACVTKRISVLK